MILKTDCRFYVGDRPCKFSKTEGVKCNSCNYYSPVKFKIVIIKLDALGDVMRTTSLLPAIKRKYPDSYITWITLKEAKDVFLNNDLVDELLFYDDAFTRFKIQTEEYDLLIHPDASPVSAAMASIIKAKNKKGFELNKNGKVVPFNKDAETWLEMGVFDDVKKANTKTYQEHIHKLSGFEYEKDEIQLQLSEDEKKFAEQFSIDKNLKRFKKIVGLNTGASKRWQLKQWREEGFIELIEMLSAYTEIGVLLYGGPDEKEKNAQLVKRFPNVVDTGTDNSLRQFFALMNLSDVIVTGDTMALHVATALKKKVVCYFGPTSANEIEDYGRITKIQPVMSCLVCYKPVCDFIPNCMQLITAKQIYDAVLNVIN